MPCAFSWNGTRIAAMPALARVSFLAVCLLLAARAPRSSSEPGFPGLPAAQREPTVPRELLDRVGAWAEKYLAELPEFTAIETRSETHWGRNGRAQSRPSAIFSYTVRRPAATAPAPVESRELLPPEAGGMRAQSKASAPAPSAFERLANPVALVSRLASRNQEKMKYFFAQDTSEAASDHVLLGYRQVQGRELIEFEGRTFAPSGQAWVDPNDGHIARIEEEFQHKSVRYSTAAEFAWDAQLNAWLPRTVTLRVFEKGRLESQVVYGYTDFRPPATSSRVQTTSP